LGDLLADILSEVDFSDVYFERSGERGAVDYPPVGLKIPSRSV
jgi:hypothetical protein